MTIEVKEPEQIVDEITGEIIEQTPPDISTIY